MHTSNLINCALFEKNNVLNYLSISIFVVVILFLVFFGSLSLVRAVSHVAPDRLILKLQTRHREQRRDVAAESARCNSNKTRHNNTEEVVSCLLLERAIARQLEYRLTLVLVGELVLSVGRGQAGNDTTKDAGNAVQPQHTARVVQLQVGLAPLLALEVADSRDNTRDTAGKHREAGAGPNNVAGSGHNNTTREDGGHQNCHVEASSHHTACKQAAQGTAREAENGIDKCEVTSHSTGHDSLGTGH